MSTPTVTAKANNGAYDVSANQWNAVVNAAKNQPYSYIIYQTSGTIYARNGTTGAVDYSGADAATVINSAITALGGHGGKILIKKGSYDIATTIHACGGLRIEGEGLNKYANQQGTCLQLTADNTAVIDVNVADNQYFFSIANIELYGNGHTTGGQTAGDITSGTFGIKLTNSFSDYLIENCFIHGFYCNIYGDTNGWYGRITNCWLEGSTFGGFFKHKQIIIANTNSSGNAYGFNFYGTARDVIINGCHIYKNTGGSLYIEHRAAGTRRYIVEASQLTDDVAGIKIYAYTGANVKISINNCEIGRVDYTTQNYALESWTDGTGTIVWQVDNTKFFTVGTAYLNTLAGTGHSFKFGCTNTGYVTEASGTSTGTGSEQTIAHGCSFTPTTAQVFLSECSTGAALAYQSDVPDATNIYVTATADKTYNWHVKY